MASTNSTLYYGAPISRWAPTFKFFNDGTADITDNGVSLLTVQSEWLIGDSSATANSTSVGSLYAVSTSVVPVYTTNIISDISSSLGTTADPSAAVDFTRELSRGVLSSPQMVNIFSNKGAVVTAFSDAIELCAKTVSENFSTDGAANLFSDIGNTVNLPKLLVCKSIYSSIRSIAISRFTLQYGAIASGTPVDASDVSVTSNSGSGTGATVNLFMTGTTVDNIVIVSTGNDYAKGDSIRIQTSVGNYLTISSLNSVQVAILNGTLDDTSGTEIPLEVNDVFSIQFTISNNLTQQNTRGKVLDTIGANVERKINLMIQLNI